MSSSNNGKKDSISAVDADQFFTSGAELMSFKVRPIVNYYNSKSKVFTYQYRYTNEFADVANFLANFKLLWEVRGERKIMKKFTLKDAEIVFVLRESGPEILVHTTTLKTSEKLSTEISNLITNFVNAISKTNEQRKQLENDYPEAFAISIEMKTKEENKILKLFRLPYDKETKAITKEHLISLSTN